MEEGRLKRELFLTTVKDWQVGEADACVRIEELMQRVKSPLILMTLDIMKQDSIRHKALLQIIIDDLEGKKDLVDLKELAELTSTLKEHMAEENKIIHVASNTYDNSPNYVVQYIASFILADEKKHHEMLNKLLAMAEVKSSFQ